MDLEDFHSHALLTNENALLSRKIGFIDERLRKGESSNEGVQ